MLLADSLIWADWFVAGGTLALAAVTAWLAVTTRLSVKTATDELRLERERISASQTPRVFPSARIEWTVAAPPYNVDPRTWPTVLPVTNGGPGVALNIWARLEWPTTGQNVETNPTSLAPGDSTDLKIDWAGEVQTNWDNVNGLLVYEDIAGVSWQTKFHVAVVTGDRRSVYVGETTRMLGDGAEVKIG